MPDIAMCLNKKCTLKNNCYRFKAKPASPAQDYGTFSQDENGNCDFYWSLKPEGEKTDGKTIFK